jgi:hypothetical protein
MIRTKTKHENVFHTIVCIVFTLLKPKHVKIYTNIAMYLIFFFCLLPYVYTSSFIKDTTNSLYDITKQTIILTIFPIKYVKNSIYY